MIVYTGGTFDSPHVGHVNFLRQCARLGEVTVVLNTDDFIERFKGKPPLFSYDERRTLLLKLPTVSRVIPNFGGEDSKPVIELIDPDIIAIASDWAGKDYYKQMSFTQEWLDERGIVLVYLPYTEIISTSEIRRRCQ
jgi:glycerol-3-phosphate cytidylyltransferase